MPAGCGPGRNPPLLPPPVPCLAPAITAMVPNRSVEAERVDAPALTVVGSTVHFPSARFQRARESLAASPPAAWRSAGLYFTTMVAGLARIPLSPSTVNTVVPAVDPEGGAGRASAYGDTVTSASASTAPAGKVIVISPPDVLSTVSRSGTTVAVASSNGGMYSS